MRIYSCTLQWMIDDCMSKSEDKASVAKSRLKVRLPYFPLYHEVRYLLNIWQNCSPSYIKGFHTTIFRLTGTRKKPLNWSDPDNWIPERLKGDELELAEKIWKLSNKQVNPRYTTGHWFLIRNYELMQINEQDELEISVRGKDFLDHFNGKTVQFIDENEGLVKLFSLISSYEPARSSDLLPEWTNYLTTYSNVRKQSMIKDTMQRRLNNLVERNLIERDSLSYNVTNTGTAYFQKHQSGVKMSIFELVGNIDEITQNILYLEQMRDSSSEKELSEYKAKIKNGRVFFPFETFDGLVFAPSRFIGYKDNSFEKHARNPIKHGSDTNSRINKILDLKPKFDEVLERKFIEFCDLHKIEPSNHKRSYWLTSTDFPPDRFDRTKNIDRMVLVTQRSQLVSIRIGQELFRKKLLEFWNWKCCLTGCKIVEILRASHIKPWKDSDNRERLDLNNGLLLAPNVDALFDEGLISFDDKGQILLSSKISNGLLESLGCGQGNRIELKDEHKKYLEFHRKKVFQRDF